MFSFDVISLYNQGFSINYIINSYYHFRNKHCNKIEKHSDCIVIPNKEITKEDNSGNRKPRKEEARKYVYQILYNHFCEKIY